MTRIGAHGRKAWSFIGSQPVYWREAALCAPAMPLLLLVGVETGHVAYAAVATGAAFSVGFGAARDLRGWRWAAMLGATAGASIAAFIGCLSGQWLPVILVVAALAAMACAFLALVDEDLWWIVLQMAVALLVASYFAGPPHAALVRAGVVLAGGAIQVGFVVALARLFPAAAARLPPAAPKDPPPRWLYGVHTLRAGVCVAVSLGLAHLLGLSNGYWAPMTAMLVLKPGLSDTNTRGLARLTGTVAGGATATLFAIAVGYAWPALVIGIAATATAAFALQKAHYAILSSAITATVVLLLSLAEGGGALLNAEHRLIATLLGGAVALVVARSAPHRPAPARASDDTVGSTVSPG
jgi:uncharacterized membrane protein YgaE (UPF0421/DUF939 family)